MQAAILLAAIALTATPEHLHWTVDDTKREALVYAPRGKTTEPAPLVFVFHGHGGSSKNADRSFHLEDVWPEAIVVYPQGLNTPTRIDPQGKRPGWQISAGAQDDRDLKLFDDMLATIKEKYRVDENRIYATGHSNGAIFTYLLWSTHPDLFAAVAPSSAPRGQVELSKPLPVFHVAGVQDRIAPFALQQATLADVRKLNGCSDKGTEWAPGCTSYPSKAGTPLVAFIHPGGHVFPKEAPALIVRFFQEHARDVAADSRPR
ncbi:MAG TPA: alpha/beta hydrolase-fold protein [Pirellulales bacterium]|nr:alpha/beta hydrolase-fold protein [Pirellulales bacterium]